MRNGRFKPLYLLPKGALRGLFRAAIWLWLAVTAVSRATFFCPYRLKPPPSKMERDKSIAFRACRLACGMLVPLEMILQIHTLDTQSESGITCGIQFRTVRLPAFEIRMPTPFAILLFFCILFFTLLPNCLVYLSLGFVSLEEVERSRPC